VQDAGRGPSLPQPVPPQRPDRASQPAVPADAAHVAEARLPQSRRPLALPRPGSRGGDWRRRPRGRRLLADLPPDL